METVQLPKEVAEFIDIVAERYGYYFGKRAIQSELMRATKAERAEVRLLGQKIGALFGEYLSEGRDVRSEVAQLQKRLAKARENLKVKSAPFYEKMRPLTKALSYMDKVVIPKRLERLGKPVQPRFQVDETILNAITKPKK